jgi:hypothetical protein
MVYIGSMDSEQDEPLEVVLRALSDRDLRLIVSLSLTEQRRRFKLTVAKCSHETTKGLPNVIFKNLERSK